MLKTALELRNFVIENALTMGRCKKDNIGEDDYKELTSLYRNALDALTEWAAKDYIHQSTSVESDNAFTAVKAILALFSTDEERIIIDQVSMRTMRDLATKPRRLYSSEYRKAHAALLNAKKTAGERYADLITLGAPAIAQVESTDGKLKYEPIDDYIKRVRESGVNTMNGTVDMLEMYKAANSVLTVKQKAEDDIKAKNNWSWKRPVAVPLNEFAELVENYVADCLIDGYNIKTSKAVRDEQAEARKAKAEAKKNA